ncbi:MAG: S8 family serine peptidase [Frankiales bacterium]|nr:S8 family serine peptidase [Frankiales bacterium]
MAAVAARRRTIAPLAVLAAVASWLVTAPIAGSTTGGAIVDPSLHAVQGTVGIIVQGARTAESAVTRMGGRITHDLPIIGGFSAKVPARDIPRVAHIPGVRYVTIDGSTTVQGNLPGGGHGNHGPADVYKNVVHANQLRAAGASGQGVTVALIDTGVTPMADTSSNLVTVGVGGGNTADCVNFSADGTCDDLYGHGTFLAGLIDGTGAASHGTFTGVAPQAKLVSVKVASADGSADVSTIIAALQWVIAFKDVYGIQVLNLSLGTNGTQSYLLSPLDFAVEKAWQAGIVTLVSASNLGPAASTIDKPADDPYIITVGAIDDQGTTTLADDSVPNFSARGPTAADGLAKPDVVAPGGHLISLAAPGATITTQFPPGPDTPAPYRRGSGTSMSTAVVSGLVADILSANPTWTPDRVKFALMSTARADASADRMAVGAGLVDGYAAAFSAPAGVANVGLVPSNGLGSLQADRGTVNVQLADANGTVVASPLSGEVSAQLNPYDAASQLLATFNGSSWYGSSWYGSSWYGSSWYGSSWYGSSWYGSSWYGSSWYGSSWYGSSWYGSSWYGSSWYGAWDQ